MKHVSRSCEVTLALLKETSLISRTSEMSSLFGLDFFSVLSRGSQYRVESVMIRQGLRQGYSFYSPTPEDVRHQPAMECIPLVLEPQSNFYEDPVVVLDFQSLYPSIIIAYNYCYTTCLGRLSSLEAGLSTGSVSLGAQGSVPVDFEHLKDLRSEGALRFSPNGILFVHEKHRQGLLPRMLQELLDARIAVKKELKSVPRNSALWNSLNDCQFGIKMLSNVCYGKFAAANLNHPISTLLTLFFLCNRIYGSWFFWSNALCRNRGCNCSDCERDS